VTTPEELEVLEREIRGHTDRLGSLLVGHHLQQSLDSSDLQMAQGHTVAVWVTYYRRKGLRRAGKRDAGVYAGGAADKTANPTGESPVMSIARFRHVAIPQVMVGNPMASAWRKGSGRPVDLARQRWVQPGDLASMGA
jgi:hypothetical protein